MGLLPGLFILLHTRQVFSEQWCTNTVRWGFFFLPKELSHVQCVSSHSTNLKGLRGRFPHTVTQKALLKHRLSHAMIEIRKLNSKIKKILNKNTQMQLWVWTCIYRRQESFFLAAECFLFLSKFIPHAHDSKSTLVIKQHCISECFCLFKKLLRHLSS